jgi:hypothetical protein
MECRKQQCCPQPLTNGTAQHTRRLLNNKEQLLMTEGEQTHGTDIIATYSCFWGDQWP